jgi:hypothetical protein
LLFIAVFPSYANNPMSGAEIDIGVFSTGCSGFELRLRPGNDINSALTNLQFTIKWPENTVGLTNFSNDYGLAQQGPVFNEDGFNYAVFVSVPSSSMPVNWLAGEEYSLMTFTHDQPISSTVDIFIAQDTWAIQNNGLYYVEMLGLDNTGTVYHEVLNAYIGACIDIGLFSTSCSGFEVRLRPGANISSELTNLQFTIKWPENTVGLINFSNDYGLAQQGPVFNEGGFNYAVFVSVPSSSMPLNWLAGEEYTVLTFDHDQSWSGTINVLIAQDDWATQNNGLYYVEMLGTDYTGDVYHEALNVSIGPCCAAYLRVFLQGAYDQASEEMRTSINLAGNLPLSQSYNTPPWNYAGTESVVSFPDSMVDWVMVELRDQNDPSLIIERRAALLSKRGLVLDTDFSDGIGLVSDPGDYYLVVDHRSHMPVMSANPVTFPNDSDPYDFREIVNTQPYLQDNPLAVVLELEPPGSGKYGIIAGDVNADGMLKYLGANDDRGAVLSIIKSVTGSSSINGNILGYYFEDSSLDNKVLYLGAGDDRGIILQNLIKLTGSSLINSVYYSVVPG